MAEQVVAENKSDRFKNYVLVGLVLITLFLFYILRNQLRVTITGMQLLVALLIVLGAAFFYYRQQKAVLLPPSHVIAQEIANWYYEHYAGVIDYTNYESKEISEAQAFVYFPSVGRTFTYRAGRGVTGVDSKDLDTTIRTSEERSLTKEVIKRQGTMQSLIDNLEQKGFRTEQ